MDPTSHGDHLVQLTRFGISNVYLVREDDGLTLIDTSIAGTAGAIVGGASRVGGEIRRIVLTHAHSDHYGSLDALHKRLPAAEVLISGRDARLLNGDRSHVPGEPEGRLFPGVFVPPAKTRPTRTIEEGERVGSLEVVAAPGHTPGQLALRDTRDGSLICGDAYLALGGLFVTTQPVKRFPIVALLATWHKPTANATAHKLRALDPSRLATGHGPVIENPGAEMDRALQEAPGA